MSATGRPWIGCLLGAGALLWAAACGPSESERAPAPAQAPAAATPPGPAAAAPSEPAAPAATGSVDVQEGAKLYATYCASCHGPKGDGDGPLAATLNPKPAKHSDAAYMSKLSDAHIFRVIKEGGAAVGKSPLMAPWGGTLTDTQIHDLVTYVRTLAK